MSTISTDAKKTCVRMAKEGKTTKEIYLEYFSKHYDHSFKSFCSMIGLWKKKTFDDDVILEAGNLSYGFIPHDATVQVNREGQIIQSWIKSKSSDNVYLSLIDTIKSLPSFEPIQKRDRPATNRMLEITFDDMHWGIATMEDYYDTLQDTLDVIENHQYKEINIIVGEDLFHTDNFRGQTSNGTYIGEVDVRKAYSEAFKFYCDIILVSLQSSETVRIFYSMGNHSETLSWAFVFLLKVKFPQLIVDDELEPRKVILFDKIFIGVTHGDAFKGSLRDLKELFVEENTMDYANAKVKEIHIGHLHHLKETGDINGCVVRRLSTKNPTNKDKYHVKHGFTMSVKRFMLFEYSSDRLITTYYV